MSDASISFPIFGEGFSINPSTYFTLFGLKVHWYGVIILTGLVLATLYIVKRAPQFGMNEDNIYDLLLYAVPIGVIGARLYYVVFNFSLYRGNLAGIFKIWEGGLAIYGGIIFGILGIFIFSRRKKIPFGNLLDLGALAVIIGQIAGRWGNFINREAFGRQTTLPWRMGLTPEGGATIFVHPTFLYESLWNFIGFIILHFWSKKRRRYDGQIAAMYIAWYGFGRFFIEGLRTDSLYLFNTGIRVSQLLAAVLFVLAAVYLLVNRFNISHDPATDLYVNRKREIAENEMPAAENETAEIEKIEEESTETVFTENESEE
ncbi:MAG: prolipoprotein diacylglyceryl transferase [Oscillospiraceae bacterium]|nr:prolipoprotein diacylglyceryl transferase [Oscillospiraceae bacterium]